MRQIIPSHGMNLPASGYINLVAIVLLHYATNALPIKNVAAKATIA